MKKLTLKHLLFEQNEEGSEVDKIYNKLSEFFARHKEKGSRIETTYNVWTEYKGYIKTEIAQAIGTLEEAEDTSENTPVEIDLVYTTQSGRFYSAYVSEPGSNSQQKYGFKQGIIDYIKELSGLEIQIPDRYNSEELDNLKASLEKKGIKMDYGDYMDIS